MRRAVPKLALAALVLVASKVSADAPVDQYDQFVEGTTTIRDAFTHLEWERKAPLTKRTWTAASTVACASFGRLPTVKELLTLVDEQPHNQYDEDLGKTVAKAIDGNAFGQFTAEDAPYWSSTPSDEPGKRWGVSFKDGTMMRLPDDDSVSYYVRCVK